MKFTRILTEDINAVRQRYSDIDDDTFNAVLTIDPTYKDGSNSVGKYTKWLLNMVKRGGGNSWVKRNPQALKDYLAKFNSLRSTLPNQDIGQFKSVEDFVDTVRLMSEDDLSDRQKERRKRNAYADAELVLDTPNWEVYVPHSYEASCTLCNGTRWCTAGSSGDHWYKDYSSQGNLYIVINKKDPSIKYQLHFPSRQFMDKEDHQVNDFTDIFDKDTLNFFVNLATDFGDVDLFTIYTLDNIPVAFSVDGCVAYKMITKKMAEVFVDDGIFLGLRHTLPTLVLVTDQKTYAVEFFGKYNVDVSSVLNRRAYEELFDEINLPDGVWKELCKYAGYNTGEKLIPYNYSDWTQLSYDVGSKLDMTVGECCLCVSPITDLLETELYKIASKTINSVKSTFFKSLILSDDPKWVKFLVDNFGVTTELAKELLQLNIDTEDDDLYGAVLKFVPIIIDSYRALFVRQVQADLATILEYGYDNECFTHEVPPIVKKVVKVHKIESDQKKTDFTWTLNSFPLYTFSIDCSDLSAKQTFGFYAGQFFSKERNHDSIYISLYTILMSIYSVIREPIRDIINNFELEEVDDRDRLLALQYALAGQLRRGVNAKHVEEFEQYLTDVGYSDNY